MVLDIGTIFTLPATQLDNEIQAGVPQSRAQFYYVGQDSTGSGVSNSTTETTVLSYTIPKNSISNGIIIEACHSMVIDGGFSDESVFNVKAGETGSEVTYSQLNYIGSQGGLGKLQADTGSIGYDGGYKCLKAVVYDVDWSKEITVLCTIQFDAASSSNYGSGYNMLITGF